MNAYKQTISCHFRNVECPNMAAGDTALWLHNKLGSTDDLWSGKSICSQLSQEKLISILDCFHALQSHVKVKLLLSFIHIPRRSIDQVCI